MIFQPYLQLMMLALCLMISCTYYAKNYAAVIGLGLLLYRGLIYMKNGNFFHGQEYTYNLVMVHICT